MELAVAEKAALTFTAKGPPRSQGSRLYGAGDRAQEKSRPAIAAQQQITACIMRCPARNERKTDQLSRMERDQETRTEPNRRELRKILARRLQDYYRALSAELPPQFREMLERLTGKKNDPN